MSDFVAYVDGGSLGNPGPSGIGVVLAGSERAAIRIARWIGRQTNDGPIRLPEPAPVFFKLDLPQVGAVSLFFYLSRPAQAQFRGKPTGWRRRAGEVIRRIRPSLTANLQFLMTAREAHRSTESRLS